MLRKIYEKAEKLLENRMLAMSVLIMVLFCVLIYRVFVLQIVQGESHKEDFTYKVQKTVKTSGTRGNIYDVNGKLLAYNKLVYTVTFQNDNEFQVLAQENETSQNYEKNKVIYEVIKILEKNGDAFINEIPIEYTGSGKFRFTETGSKLKKFKRDVFGIGNDTSDLSASEKELRKKQLNASAEEVFEYLRNGTMGSAGTGKMFEIDKKYSNEDALKIMSVRYSAFLSRYSQYMKVTVATEISSRSIAEIKERSSELPGIDIDTKSIRVYNKSEAMSHIIGYTGTVSTDELETYNKGKNEDDKDYYSSDETVGKSGIEKELESYLHGDSGSKTMIVNNIGKVIQTTKTVKAGTGNNVTLSIDSELQEYVYNLLEKKIAGIVLSKLTTSDSKGENSDDIRIPIKEAYYALIGNGIIDLENLNGKDATSYEKSMYRKIQTLKDSAISMSRSMILSSNKAYKDESDEKQAYASYIYSMLSDNKVLLSSSIDTSDKVYQRWKDEKIGLGEFLRYAINKEWIDISSLKIDSKYNDTEEIMKALADYVEDQLIEADDFNMTVCEQKILNGKLSGREVCLLLYEQGILKKKGDSDYTALKSGSMSSYDFIYKKLKNLEITPAQLGLDPCSGSVVITDPQSGKVKAMVSYPGYDSNRLSNGTDSGYYRQLVNSSSTPLYNQVLNHKTAPGSTFKPLAALAGLNEKVITTGTVINCTGLYDKITPAAKCWKYPSKHGARTVTSAIEASCNSFFYEVGYQLGNKSGSYSSKEGLAYLEKYATQLGLNKKSGIELDEASPQVSDETSVRSAIGQGRNSFTPSQISNYVTTLSNRGTVYDLSILNKITDDSGKTVKKYGVKKKNQLHYNSEYWDAVQAGMRGVINGADSSVNNIFKGMKVNIAGKTGTAQEDKKRPNHALFISYGPYEKPEITTTVVIPFGYTSANAAATAREIYEYYFANDKTKAKLEKSNHTASVSNLGAAGD